MTILTGNFKIAREPELRALPNTGDQVLSLNLVYAWSNKKGADGYKPSQFVRATLFGKRAHTLQPYLQKGQTVFAVLDGVHVRTYAKQDGTTAASLEARVSDIEFVAGERAAPAAAPAPAPAPATRPAAVPADDPFAGMDDDIPFANPYASRALCLAA